MSIEVIISNNSQYRVLRDGDVVANIPIAYLEGRKNPNIGKHEITQAFTLAFTDTTLCTYNHRQRCDLAFSFLGLLNH